jgi:hypothetical protein
MGRAPMRMLDMEIIPLWTRYNEHLQKQKISSNDNHSRSGLLYSILVTFLILFLILFHVLFSFLFISHFFRDIRELGAWGVQWICFEWRLEYQFYSI